MKENKIKVAKEIAAVRKKGRVNMFDLKGVVDQLCKLNLNKTAEYVIRISKKEYINLLKLSSKY